MKTATTKKKHDARETPAARVVYTQAPVLLAVVLAPEGDAWRVRVGTAERVVGVDASVDPALLEDARSSGARVVLDATGEPVIVGVLATQRAVTIDREGDVNASVRRLKLETREEALITAPGAFVQLKAHEAEIYATRVLTRARELARILGRMVKLN